jgi:hypothetical protein
MALEAPYTPVPVDDVMLAFPADVSDLMPDYDWLREQVIDPEWVEFQRRWFFSGLPGSVEIDLKDGIDGETAFRHLKAIQGSFQPKHEHKEAAVAFLASQWFNSIDYGEGE